MKPLVLASLPFRIQTMTPAHIPTVAAIEKDTFGAPWPESAFVQEVSHNPYSTYLILQYLPPTKRKNLNLTSPFRKGRVDPSIIGYGGFWQMVDEAHICTLAMRQDWRSRGLGELLLLALIRQAMELDIERLSLEVRLSNTIAQSLYRKYGFEVVGDRPRYYSDNQEDALIMTTSDVRTPNYKQTVVDLSNALLEQLNTLDLESLPTDN